MNRFFKIFLIGILAGLLFSLASCSKENDFPNVDPGQAKIEFSLYGSTKTYVEVNAGAQKITGTKVYSFVGTKSPAAENIFTLTFMTDSLRPGSYSVNTGVVNFREGTRVVTNVSSPDFMVNITSNVNGLVNGTFSGTLYDHQTGSNCAVINGKIENVQLVYR